MDTDTGLYIYCLISEKAKVEATETKELLKGVKNDQLPFTFGNIGVRSQPIFKITYKDLSVIISNFSLKQLKVNIDDVIAHQKVVETIRKEIERNVLPIRFGTILRSRLEVTNLLSQSYNEYKSKIINFNGKDEFGIKILITDTTREKLKELVESESEQIQKIKNSISSLSADKSGSDYLLKLSLKDAIKNEIFKKIEHLALGIHKQFAELSSEATLLKADTEHIILNSAYLVSQNDSTNFESKFMELKKEFSSTGLIFHMSGPWAPYSFC